MLNGAQILSKLLVGGHNVTNIVMKEKKTPNLHQFLIVGPVGEAKATPNKGRCRSWVQTV